ncbi:MAG: hypothetical protein AAB919_02205 [Patescibacteria group bacterium]
MRKQPKNKGAAIFKIILVAIFTILAGPIIGALIGCAVGLWCFQNGDGSPGEVAIRLNDPCTSAPNACGQTNTGFVIQTCVDGPTPDPDEGVGSFAGPGLSAGGGQICTPSCNATTPPDSQCPPPVIPPTTGFYADPTTVGRNGTTTLHWEATDASDCAIAGDDGFAHSGGGSGSVSSNPLVQTTTFTLTCTNSEDGPSVSDSVRVIINPRYKEI